MGWLDRLTVGRELQEEVMRLRCEVRTLRRAHAGDGGFEPLLRILRALRDARTREEFLALALEVAVSAAGASRAAVIRFDADRATPVAARSRGGAIAPDSFPFSRSITLAVARSGALVVTGHVARDRRFGGATSVKALGMESVLCLPLRRGERSIGCLYLDWMTGNAEADEATDPRLVIAIADALALALERLEGELDALRRSRLEAVGLAAASIAHDLASPLSTAQLAVSRARAATEEPAVQDALELAHRAHGRAREAATSLLWLASGRDRRLDLRPWPLGDLVKEHVAGVRAELESRGIVLDLRIEFTGTVLVDRDALLRVLSNAVCNAQDAMRKGGRLTLATGATDGSAWVDIEDTGEGIPPDVLARLFRPFETMGKEGGTGLGLALSRELVDAMGGAIELSSQVGAGTRVRVRLPRHDPAT